MSQYKVLAHRYGLVALTNVFVGLSSIVLLPILTKTISAADYGTWVLINVTIGLVPNLITLGLPYAMVRFLAASKQISDIQEVFYSIAGVILFTAGVVALLLFFVPEPLADSLYNGNITVTKTLGIIIFLAALNLHLFNYFRTFQLIKIFSIFTFAQTALTLGLVAFFVLSGFGIVGASIGLLITQALLFIFMGIIIFSKLGFSVPKMAHIKEYLTFSLPTIPSQFSSWIVDSSDKYLIGILLGSTFVAYYSPGYALGSTIVMLISPLTLLLPATLSAYYDEGNLVEVKNILKYSLKYFLALAVPVTVVLSLLSKPILLLLSTPEIAAQGYQITLFSATSAVLWGAYGIIVQPLVLSKETQIMGKIWIFAAAGNFFLNLVLIPRVGLLGAGITTLLAYLTAFIITLFYSSKTMRFDYDIRFILKCILASLAASIALYAWQSTTIFNILLSLGFYALAYVVLLLLSKGFTKDELKFFLTTIRIG